MPNSGVLWIGDPSWVATANNISVANSIRPLVWNATLTNQTRDAVQAAANASQKCGVDTRPSQGISFTLTTPIWERAANSPLLRMQSAAWNAPPSAVNTGYLGSQFAASDIRPLAYVFAGPDPVAIGCVVQSCNTSFSLTTCLTNLTTNSSAAAAATSFALDQRQPLRPVGAYILLLSAVHLPCSRVVPAPVHRRASRAVSGGRGRPVQRTGPAQRVRGGGRMLVCAFALVLLHTTTTAGTCTSTPSRCYPR